MTKINLPGAEKLLFQENDVAIFYEPNAELVIIDLSTKDGAFGVTIRLDTIETDALIASLRGVVREAKKRILASSDR